MSTSRSGPFASNSHPRCSTRPHIFPYPRLPYRSPIKPIRGAPYSGTAVHPVTRVKGVFIAVCTYIYRVSQRIDRLTDATWRCWILLNTQPAAAGHARGRKEMQVPLRAWNLHKSRTPFNPHPQFISNGGQQHSRLHSEWRASERERERERTLCTLRRGIRPWGGRGGEGDLLDNRLHIDGRARQRNPPIATCILYGKKREPTPHDVRVQTDM